MFYLYYMFKKATAIISFVSLSILSGCSEYDCTRADIYFSLIGFSDAEARSVILRRFTKGTAQLKDTFYYRDPYSLQFSRTNDTLNLASIPLSAILESDYDYQLLITQSNSLYTITEINEPKNSIRKSIFNNTKEGCINLVSSYKVNGVLITNDKYLANIYLKK